MKKAYKVYLTNEDIKLLKSKAEELGINTGRGWLSEFLRFISKQKIAVFNENLKSILKHLINE